MTHDTTSVDSAQSPDDEPQAKRLTFGYKGGNFTRGSIAYHIRQDYGAHFVTLPHGGYIDLPDLKHLIESLQFTYEELSNGVLSQRDLYEQYAITTPPNIFSTAKLLYPFNASHLTYRPKNRRKSSSATFSCVYFVTSYALDDNVLKIGKTTDFYMRTKTLRSEWKGDVEVIAALVSPHIDELEIVVHEVLAPYRIEREFFTMRPVIGWLNDFKQEHGE